MDRALVFGKSGQVASALARLSLSSEIQYHFVDRSEADLRDQAFLLKAFATHEPRICINAAAYTAVDKAEEERELALAVNSTAVGWLADLCVQHNIPLLHLSTDFVFNGRADTPYSVNEPISPINAYGITKAAGELAIRERLSRHVIVRLAWIFSETGNNFLQSMLRVGREKPVVRVVTDQIGPPSYAYDIATALDHIVREILDDPDATAWGTYHLANSGAASRHEFAKEIFRLATKQGYPCAKLEAVDSSMFPTSAKRPAYSVLDCTAAETKFGIKMRPWQDALADCMARIFTSTSTSRSGS